LPWIVNDSPLVPELIVPVHIVAGSADDARAWNRRPSRLLVGPHRERSEGPNRGAPPVADRPPEEPWHEPIGDTALAAGADSVAAITAAGSQTYRSVPSGFAASRTARIRFINHLRRVVSDEWFDCGGEPRPTGTLTGAAWSSNRPGGLLVATNRAFCASHAPRPADQQAAVAPASCVRDRVNSAGAGFGRLLEAPRNAARTTD
jgi:hypothetical protein